MTGQQCQPDHSRRDRSPWLRRWSVAAIVAAVAVVGVTTVHSGSSDHLPMTASAYATAKPGEPGGNHSTPGDNKKKNQQRDRNNDNNYFDRNNNSQQPGQQDSQRQRPTSRVDATQIDRTAENNRLTPDGNNRSVGIQTGNDGSARQSAPDQQPANVTQQEAERAAEALDGIPPKRALNAAEQDTYNYFRGPNPARRLPSDAAARETRLRFERGDLPYNGRPFGEDFDAGDSSVDHLVAIRRAVQIPGLSELDRARQESIFDDPRNLIRTPIGENVSRRDLTYAEWPGRRTGPPIDPEYRAARIAQETEVYRYLQQRVNEEYAAQFPGRPLPSAGPLELDRTAPPLDINPTLPADALPLQPSTQVPIQSPVEMPSVPAPIEVPANPVPAGPNYPLPPAAQPAPPIVNPAPPGVGNPAPVVIPNGEPPAIGAPQTPPIANPLPPDIANPIPVSPWETLFPGAVPTPTSPLASPGDIVSMLPRGLPSAAAVAPTEPTIRIPIGEILKRLPGELIQAPGLLIPMPPPVVGPCQVGACPTKIAMGLRHWREVMP